MKIHRSHCWPSACASGKNQLFATLPVDNKNKLHEKDSDYSYASVYQSLSTGH
jgi:hypothetical protein